VNEHDDIGRELRETRAEPTREFARELDERAAEWLRERPRRRLPSLRIAIPAVATAVAAAVVLGLVISGGDDGDSSELEVAVVSDQGTAEAVGGGSQLDLRKESEAPRALEGAVAVPQKDRLEEGEPVVVRYFFSAPTKALIELGGRETQVNVPAGAGRLEISTDGLPAGTHKLVISVRSMPPYRRRIEIAG
jgi:hypothetical protein